MSVARVRVYGHERALFDARTETGHSFYLGPPGWSAAVSKTSRSRGERDRRAERQGALEVLRLVLRTQPRSGTARSIHQHQHGGLLHGLHHVLELAVLRVGFLQLGGDFGDGIQKTLGGTRVSRVVSGGRSLGGDGHALWPCARGFGGTPNPTRGTRGAIRASRPRRSGGRGWGARCSCLRRFPNASSVRISGQRLW